LLRNAAAVLVLLVLATGARADLDEFELEDTVAIVVVDRELVAHAVGRGSSKLRLEPGERLIWHGSSGRIGFVVTDRRILGFHRSTGWSDRRLLIGEASPARPELGPRIALFVTSQRAVAYDGHWRQEAIGPQEGLFSAEVGSGAALVVTSRRALALSSISGQFVAAELGIHERIESARTISSSAEVTTSKRVLFFSGASWTVQDRSIVLQRCELDGAGSLHPLRLPRVRGRRPLRAPPQRRYAVWRGSEQVSPGRRARAVRRRSSLPCAGPARRGRWRRAHALPGTPGRARRDGCQRGAPGGRARRAGAARLPRGRRSRRSLPAAQAA
jgi:hypothetical protein